MSITLEPEHGFVLLSAVAIVLQCFFAGFGVARVRYTVFSKKFIASQLQAESDAVKKEFGTGLKKGN